MSITNSVHERRLVATPRGINIATQVVPHRAENASIWDVDGRHFIDFAGGIAVLNIGHRHPKVIDAVSEQLERYTHTAYQVMCYEPYVRLAERLNMTAAMSGPLKTALFTTGAEAVENAIKIARATTGRSGVLAFSGAFHGRTFMTMAMTGKVKPYKSQFGPMPGQVYHLPFPVAHYGHTVESTLTALDSLFRSDIDPKAVAAVIVEPVQGEGGFHILPSELVVALRNICDEHGILLIADEVQSGFGRTGKLFAFEHFEVEPDIIVCAKSLAGGFPLSAVIGRAEIMDSVEPGGLGGTYAGSPVSCAAALAVLDVIEQENILEKSDRLGRQLFSYLESLAGRSDITPFNHIRGLGAMVAFDMVREWGSDEPSPEAARRLTQAAVNNGLILLACGIHGETIRMLMPLTIDDKALHLGLERLTTAFREAQV